MFNNKVLFSAAAIILSGLYAPAQSETIQDSVAQAIISHPGVETANIAKEVNLQDKREAISGFFPQVSVGAQAARVYADTSTTRGLTVDRGAGYSWLGEGNAAVTQPIFDGFEAINRVHAANLRGLSADYNVENVKENLAFQAAQAHVQAYYSQEKVSRTNVAIENMKNYRGRIQLLVDEGAADESELSQAENIILSLEEERINNEGQLKIALAQYNEIVGQYPMDELEEPENIEALLNDNLEDVLQTIPTHPSLQSGEYEIGAAKYDVRVEQSGFYPSLDGELSYLKRDQREVIGGETEDARVGLRLSWDFETGGAQLARLRRAQAQRSETISRNNEIMKQIEGAVRRAYAEYNTAEKQYAFVVKRQDKTKQLLETYDTQFEGGKIRLIQLMQADNQLFNTEIEAIDAKTRMMLAQYSILSSLGTLEDTMLASSE